jgi:hypothetical protein
MSKAVQRRRGTTAEHTTFTGALGELTVDTTKDTIVVHDGAAAGGYPLLREDGSNSALALGSAGTPSLKFTGDPNTGIYSPGADQVAISTNAVERVKLGTSEVVFNDGGNDIDFRIEGDTNSSLFFVDASTDRVGVGTTSPVARFQINSPDTSVTPGFTIRQANNVSAGYDFDVNTSTGGMVIYGNNENNATRKIMLGFDRASGNVGIGTTSPGSALEINAAAATSPFIAKINTAEVARIDSSGRLLVGTSTARSNLYSATVAYTPPIQFEANTNSWGNGVGVLNYSASGYGGTLALGLSASNTRGTNTLVANNETCGKLQYLANDGTNFYPIAEIQGVTDGATATGDVPGRLVFSTTADGAASPTERMRISSGGYLKASDNGTYISASGAYHEFRNTTQSGGVLVASSTQGSYDNTVYFANVVRTANAAYSFFQAYSGNITDKEFDLYGDGNGKCDGAWTGGGADYAEYFEWSDGNPDAIDRRGISVVLDGDKIRPALAGEDPVGVISGNPSVVGDAAWNKWSGKYLRDDYGTYIQEDYEVVNDEGETVVQQRRKLNPAYDPDVEYTSREERPEWDCVGLMGKLRIRKGQPTGSRWIKMRDISATVEEWLVR